MFVAVALPSLAYRDASEYNADLEGLQLMSFFTWVFFEDKQKLTIKTDVSVSS